jgi:hypothetical protein
LLEWKKLLKDRTWDDKNSVPDSMWRRKAIWFFGVVLSGGDTEAFWEELLA